MCELAGLSAGIVATVLGALSLTALERGEPRLTDQAVARREPRNRPGGSDGLRAMTRVDVDGDRLRFHGRVVGM
jgi:hypothetical protein